MATTSSTSSDSSLVSITPAAKSAKSTDEVAQTLRGMRFTLFVCAVMTWGWGFLTLINMKGVTLPMSMSLPLLVAIPLFLLALRFTLRIRGLRGPRLFATRRSVFWYFTGLVVEIIGCALAVIIARLSHHPEYVIPGDTLIVGLHFLFLAIAFNEKRQYLTLAVFCLTALLVPLTVPRTFTVGPISTLSTGGSGWMIVTGLIGLLWLSLVFVRLYSEGMRATFTLRQD